MYQRIVIIIISCGLFSFNCLAQQISAQLENAIQKLSADVQFRHSILSMYVVNTKTGSLVYEKNAQLGAAPASCQKVVISAAAFELLGKSFVYKTLVAYDGEIKNNVLNGSVYIIASGDPTLGSWRWKQTKEDIIINQITSALIQNGIQKIKGGLYIHTKNWDTNITPDGWVWEDIGNYYGAGAAALNWRENQYDLTLKSGNAEGDKVSVMSVKPALNDVAFTNELRTGAKGSGDNAYIYLPPFSTKGFIRGTIPAGENNFLISGAMPDPAGQMVYTLMKAFKQKQVEFLQPTTIDKAETALPNNLKILCTFQSPTLDSMNYWFLKKSINLYGEAFVKTIGFQKKQAGFTDSGIAIIKEFWSRRGIEKSALKIIDGSGLSPANRITTNALVTAMQYASKQSWYLSFYNALPEMNGIKMKDGYIGGVRSYTGYVKSKSGVEYTFSFIVNNFDGSAGSVREKMWKVLDLLK